MSEQRARGFWGRLGAILDATRRWTLNIIFLLVIGSLCFTVYSLFRVNVPEGGVLVLAPEGTVVDQYTAVDTVSHLSGNLPAETLLGDLIEAVDLARQDPTIEILLLKLDRLNHIGLSNTLELADTIAAFREAGKTVVASSTYYDQDQYFLASQADEIYVHNMGGVSLEGFAVVRNYFREAIDKLKIQFHVFKVGSYKSAVEPLIRDDMSAEAQEANRQWLEELWGLYRNTVLERRKITEARFDYFVNHIDKVLQKREGDSAQAALDFGLVDGIVSRPALSDRLAERVGRDAEGYFKQVHFWEYLQFKRGIQLPNNDAPVGLIVASGPIVDGDHPPGTIGGDSLAWLIRQARMDDTLKAVVLRINSGGGSVLASEIIRGELEALQAAGKPLVVSMGSSAASGGYWIAAGADEIWATPATLTGSIGIFGAFPTFQNALESLGVSTDGVGTTDVAGKLRADRPLDPVHARSIQEGLQYGYQRFLNIVAEGRGKLPQQVSAIAEGRVWSGVDAKQIGLVDHLGSLQQALDSAAKLAGQEGADSRLLRLPLSPEQELLRLLFGSGFVTELLPAAWADQLQSWLAPLASAQLLSDLMQLRDPRGMYAYCLTCAAP